MPAARRLIWIEQQDNMQMDRQTIDKTIKAIESLKHYNTAIDLAEKLFTITAKTPEANEERCSLVTEIKRIGSAVSLYVQQLDLKPRRILHFHFDTEEYYRTKDHARWDNTKRELLKEQSELEIDLHSIFINAHNDPSQDQQVAQEKQNNKGTAETPVSQDKQPAKGTVASMRIQDSDKEKAQNLLRAIGGFVEKYNRIEEAIRRYVLTLDVEVCFPEPEVLSALNNAGIDGLEPLGKECSILDDAFEKIRFTLYQNRTLGCEFVDKVISEAMKAAYFIENRFSEMGFFVHATEDQKPGIPFYFHNFEGKLVPALFNLSPEDIHFLLSNESRLKSLRKATVLTKAIDDLELRELAGENKKEEPKKVVSMVNQQALKGFRIERDHNIDLLSGKPNCKKKNNLGLSDLAGCLWSLDEQIARLGHRGDPFPDSDAFDLNKCVEKTEEILAIMAHMYQLKKNLHIREAMITLSKLNRDLKAVHSEMDFASAPSVAITPDGKEDNLKEIEGEVSSILETFYNKTCPEIKQVYHPFLMDMAATFETDSKLSSQIISDEIDQSSVLLDNIHSVVRNLKKVANPDIDYNNLTQLEMAIADEAVLNYLTERFGQQDDAVGNWPSDWHECPEAIELWKKTIRDIWLSRSIDNLTSTQKELEMVPQKTPSTASVNNLNSVPRKRQELIEGITPELFDWEKPFTPKQIDVIEQKLDPLAKDIGELAEFIETADDFIKTENKQWYEWTSGDMKVSGFDHSGFSEDAISQIFLSVLSAKVLRNDIEKLMASADAKDFYQQLQIALHLIINENGVSLDIPAKPVPPERHSPAGKNLAARLRQRSRESLPTCANIFKQVDDFWMVRFNGEPEKPLLIKDQTGMGYIAKVLASYPKPVLGLSLASPESAPELIEKYRCMTAEGGDEFGSGLNTEMAVAIIDEAYVENCKKRLTQIEADKQGADSERLEELETEEQQIRECLGEAHKPGSQEIKTFMTQAKKAAKAVDMAIVRAEKAIGKKGLASLSNHFNEKISMQNGVNLIYKTDRKIDWEL